MYEFKVVINMDFEKKLDFKFYAYLDFTEQ